MGRVAVILILFFSFASAKWCIYHAMQKRIYQNEDKTFYSNFPHGTIIKRRGWYWFISGPYDTKDKTLQMLRLAKKLHADAYMKPCRGLWHNTKKLQSKYKKEQTRQKKSAQKPHTAIISSSPMPQKFSLTQQISKQEDQKKEEEKKELYYSLSFEEFLHRLLNYEYGAKNIDYRRKLEELEAVLEHNIYDWDIFANVTAGYSKFIDYDLATNKELTLNGGVGIQKRLFDKGYLLKERIEALKKRLAKLRSIRDKDKLALYALQIYMDAYANQQIKDIYQRLYFNQKAFFSLISERFKVGLAGKVDYIDAKNDLLSIKRAFLDKIYDTMYSDFVIRNAIGLDVGKPVRLQEFGLMAREGSLESLYQKALEKNPDITIQRYLFELQKEYLQQEKNAHYPILELSTGVSYEYKKDFGTTPHKSAKGLNYNLGLNMKIPLYGPEVSSEALQKEKIKTLVQKNSLLQSIKEKARQIHRYYNEIERIDRTLEIIQEQQALMQEKLKLVKERYKSGLASYRQYSDALAELLRLSEERYMLQATRVRDEGILAILQGKHLFYGED